MKYISNNVCTSYLGGRFDSGSFGFSLTDDGQPVAQDDGASACSGVGLVSSG